VFMVASGVALIVLGLTSILILLVKYKDETRK
jgi:hypothetical protein